ncbi:hypothetical protein Pst134EB_006120 [Puccinia striiformis f. sp. tritici]|nr:hypothetical protein Pst134EB_006120 [Puccinia striiformis f. sp. tritici]
MFKFFQTIAVGLLLLQVAMAFPATLDLRGRSVAKRQATGGGPIGGGNGGPNNGCSVHCG